MAMLTRTTPGSPKALQRFHNCIAFLWPSLQAQQQSRPSPPPHHQMQVQCKSTQLDTIDCFTNELVQRKARKWEDLRDSVMRKQHKETSNSSTSTSASTSTTSFTQTVGILSQGVMNDLEAIRSPQLGLDIRSLSQAQLDNLLMSTMEIKNNVDFLYLIRQCIEHEQLPSAAVLLASFKYLTQLRRGQPLEALATLCASQSHPLAKTYGNFAPFKALVQWRNGAADVALMTLHRAYGQCLASDEGRRVMRNAFRNIVEETLAQKSEAVLVSLMEVARAINAEFKDIFVVACVWKQCFVSEWFCDQKSAAELFEHYKELQQLVERRSSSLCASFLRAHNVDAVHRLIEVFLQYKQREACANCLSLLFNYQYLRRDLRACAEIIKSCSELEMPLSALQNEQFLSLFLNQSPLGDSIEPKPVARKTPKSFQYKF